MSASRHKTFNAWLQLMRPPNLLTVPGDPASGFLLASSSAGHISYAWLLLATIIALLFYMAGLVVNDCFDWREDASTRPERPIPSGAITLRAAVAAAGVLFAAGLMLAGIAGGRMFGVALALAVCIMAYNAFGKRIPVCGVLLMGGCRGGSLLLGAVATGMPFAGLNRVVIAAAGLAVYIAAVTSLAGRETEATPIPVRRWLPSAAVTVCMLGLLVIADTVRPLFVVLGGVAAAWPFVIAWRLSACPEPKVLIPSIGRFIRGLLLIQAAWMAYSGPSGILAAGIALSAWPASVYISRRFYAS